MENGYELRAVCGRGRHGITSKKNHFFVIITIIIIIIVSLFLLIDIFLPSH